MRKAIVIVPRTGAGTRADPYRCDLALGWTDVTGQPVEDVKTGKMAYTVEVTCTEAQMTALRNDNRFVVLCDVDAETNEKAPVMDTARKTDFKAKLAALYSPEVVAYVTTLKDDPELIAQALKECQLRPPWKVGAEVKIGEVYAFGNNLWRCVQAHRTQADWTPDKTPALWVKFYELSAGPQPWKQPAGAHDAYQIGVKVTHKSRTWENTTANNVWEPGIYGWKDIGAAVTQHAQSKGK